MKMKDEHYSPELALKLIHLLVENTNNSPSPVVSAETGVWHTGVWHTGPGSALYPIVLG